MIKIGAVELENIFIGNNLCASIYVGNTKIWPIDVEEPDIPKHIVTFEASGNGSIYNLNVTYIYDGEETINNYAAPDWDNPLVLPITIEADEGTEVNYRYNLAYDNVQTELDWEYTEGTAIVDDDKLIEIPLCYKVIIDTTSINPDMDNRPYMQINFYNSTGDYAYSSDLNLDESVTYWIRPNQSIKLYADPTLFYNMKVNDNPFDSDGYYEVKITSDLELGITGDVYQEPEEPEEPIEEWRATITADLSDLDSYTINIDSDTYDDLATSDYWYYNEETGYYEYDTGWIEVGNGINVSWSLMPSNGNDEYAGSDYITGAANEELEYHIAYSE